MEDKERNAEAERLAEAARLAEADAKAWADEETRWQESFPERSAQWARLDAERHARNVAHAKKAAAARWKDGKGPQSKSVRLYAEDLSILSRFRPWDGHRVGPALAVHRLLSASFGLLWRYDEKGRVITTGPLRDACRQPPPSAPAE